MTGIERGTFPEITFTEALDIANRIRAKNIKTAAALSLELGYSANTHGGSLYYKRSALSKHYRILEPSKTMVTFTRLGERLVHQLNEADRAAAVRESILGVPLVAKLFEALGPTYHPDDFRPKLSQLTGASPAEVASVARRYEEVYLDAANHLRKLAELPGTPAADSSSSSGRPKPTGPTPEIESPGRFSRPVRTFNLDNHYSIVVALDREAIEEAVALLEALKGRLKDGPTPVPPHPEKTGDADAGG